MGIALVLSRAGVVAIGGVMLIFGGVGLGIVRIIDAVSITVSLSATGRNCTLAFIPLGLLHGMIIQTC